MSSLKRIRFVAFDLDGTLTDGSFYYMGDGVWSQRFSARDGVGIKLLQERGVEVGFLTHSQFESARERAKMLGIREAHFGVRDKLEIWKDILERLGLEADECAYMGDEDTDIPVLRVAGLSGTVMEAEERIKHECDFIATRPAGGGAGREFAELILSAYD